MVTYVASVSSEQGVNRLDENPCRLIDFARLMLSDGKAHSGRTGEHRNQPVSLDPDHASVQKTIGLLKGR